MDNSELQKLKERYSRLADEAIKELLLAGKSEFEPEAFNLLVEEAHKRQVELGAGIAASEKDVSPAEALNEELDQEGFAEVAVLNDPGDCEWVKKTLSVAGINFYFQPVSYSGQELPVALFVQQQRADDSLKLFQDFHPKSSIVLW